MHIYTGCSLNIVFFLKNAVIFLNSASSAAAPPVFDLPLCTLTVTEGKPERGQSPEYISKSLKNTIYNEHPVHQKDLCIEMH